jgi:hypothetical protein
MEGRKIVEKMSSFYKALEMLKLSPDLDLQKIEEMKMRIPDIGVNTESTVEKPLPGSRGVNPR